MKDFIIPKCANKKTMQDVSPSNESSQAMCCLCSDCNRECETYGKICLFDSELNRSVKAYKEWAKSNFENWIYE